MSAASRAYVPEGSRLRAFAEAVAWLWRLGPVSETPSAEAVGFGWLEDAPGLDEHMREGRLRAAVVFAPRPGPEVGRVPGRERVSGVADFPGAGSVQGQFTVMHGGEASLSSSLGVHVTREPGWMVAGIDPDASWGTLDGHWLYGELLDFVADSLEEPLLLLPQVGWFRYDDVPGNAYQQLAGRDHDDAYWVKRLESLRESFAGSGSVVNLAVTPKCLVDGELAFIDRVWPRALEQVRKGIEEGVFEVVAHGYSHVEPKALARDEAEPKEFRDMSREEAADRVSEGIDWLTETTGSAPHSFVAPTWSYGDGLIEALAERDMPAWLPARPGPLIEGGFARESLVSTLDGLHKLDYSPFGSLAGAGLPPTLVIHGGLFDSRMRRLRKSRDLPTLARLAARRDMFRVAEIEGVRWLAAGELLSLLRAHDRSTVEHGEPRLAPGAQAILFDGQERREVGG